MVAGIASLGIFNGRSVVIAAIVPVVDITTGSVAVVI